MIIPGLTDVDLSAMANMSIEELNDLETLANERAKEFQMQLEAIQGIGGVSKEHASQFKAVLPPQIVMESFTAQVTHTNYQVAVESLTVATGLIQAVCESLQGLKARMGEADPQITEDDHAPVKLAIEAIRNA